MPEGHLNGFLNLENKLGASRSCKANLSRRVYPTILPICAVLSHMLTIYKNDQSRIEKSPLEFVSLLEADLLVVSAISSGGSRHTTCH